MIRIVTLFLLLALAHLGQPAVAMVSTIRSGDHADFTRLVVRMPEGADWSVEESPNGFALRISGVENYDLTGVFDRITRDRIAALSTEGGVLFLDVICRCDADAFEWRADALVLDVVDVPGGAVPGAVAVPEQTVQARPPDEPALLPVVTLPSPFAVAPSPQAAASTGTVAPASGTEDAQEPAIVPEIAANIRAAALDGILTPAETPSSPEPTPDATSALPADLMAVGPGVVAAPSMIELNLTPLGFADCPADEDYAVAEWATKDEPFFDQLSRLRVAVRTETGRVDTTARLKLARFYAAHGFAVEALALAQDQTPEEHALRTVVAAILNDNAQQVPTFSGCGAGAIFWAAVSHQNLTELTAEDQRAMIDYFAELPATLRAIMGPRFSRLLSESGAIGVASAVLERSAPSTLVSDAEALSAQAELARATNGPVAVVDVLVGADPADLAPSQIAEAIESALQSNVPVPQRLIELAGPMKVEARGTPAGKDLASAELRALLAQGNFAAAENSLNYIRRTMHPELAGLTNEWMDAVTSRSEDPTFLIMAFGALPAETTSEARARVAERLVSLGFVQQALRVAPDFAISGEPFAPIPLEGEVPAAAPGLNTDLPPLAAREAMLRNSEGTRERIQALLNDS